MNRKQFLLSLPLIGLAGKLFGKKKQPIDQIHNHADLIRKYPLTEDECFKNVNDLDVRWYKWLRVTKGIITIYGKPGTGTEILAKNYSDEFSGALINVNSFLMDHNSITEADELISLINQLSSSKTVICAVTTRAGEINKGYLGRYLLENSLLCLKTFSRNYNGHKRMGHTVVGGGVYLN